MQQDPQDREIDPVACDTCWSATNRRPFSADEIPGAVRKALAIAAAGRPGPVMLDVPKDVQLAPLSGRAAPAALRRFAPSVAVPPRSSLDRAAALISTARRPVLYGGGGLVNSGPRACEAFTELARRLGNDRWHREG